MFILRIHSLNAISTPIEGGAITISSAFTNPNLKIKEFKGTVHLYTNFSRNSLPNSLFVLAVPNHFSTIDFLRFCGTYIKYASEIVFIRNGEIKDPYSVLIKFDDVKRANAFCLNFNGRRFSSTEVLVCHIFYTATVVFKKVREVIDTPPPGFIELPTCPVCLERLDQKTSGIMTTLCDHSFQCGCISKWTNSSCQVCHLFQQQVEDPKCSVCSTSENLWICLICGSIGCGRFQEGHALKHWKSTEHCYCLSLEAHTIWDYVDHEYVHRQSKIDEVEPNHYCGSCDGDSATCECPEDSRFSGAALRNKIEGILDDYNQLLASQLENQRQHYDKLLVEVESKREKSISDAVEKAMNSKLQEVQLNIENCVVGIKKLTNALLKTNDGLIMDQEFLRTTLTRVVTDRVVDTEKVTDGIVQVLVGPEGELFPIFDTDISGKEADEKKWSIGTKGDIVDFSVVDELPDMAKDAQGQETGTLVSNFITVEGMKVMPQYVDLYKKIYDRYGRLECGKILGMLEMTYVTFTSELLHTIKQMMDIRPIDLSVAKIELWEARVGIANALGYNVCWLQTVLAKMRRYEAQGHKVDGGELEASIQVMEEAMKVNKKKRLDLAEQLDHARLVVRGLEVSMAKAETVEDKLVAELEEAKAQKAQMSFFDGLL